MYLQSIITKIVSYTKLPAFRFRSQIGKQLKHDFYTSVLGFNAFLGIALSTCLSSLIVRIGMSLPVRVR